jgi:Ala-tRNA(Pro) deacylase
MDTEAALFRRFDELGIVTRTHRHPPVFTVEEARRHVGHLPGGHNKSLFVGDKKGALWLVVCGDEQRVDLKTLSKRLGAASRLSFGKAELLQEILGVEPGSVTPFALINDREGRVQPVLDRTMLAQAELNFHPLRNDATTTIASADLIRFVESCGHRPLILDLAADEVAA